MVQAGVGVSRSRPRRSKRDAVLALLVPCVGLLTFPNRFARPSNLLHSFLRGIVPRHDWKYLPSTCIGTPYGPPDLVRTELLLDLADDTFIFTLAMAALCLLAAVLTRPSAARVRDTSSLMLWTLLTTLLSVLAWVESCGRGLAAM